METMRRERYSTRRDALYGNLDFLLLDPRTWPKDVARACVCILFWLELHIVEPVCRFYLGYCSILNKSDRCIRKVLLKKRNCILVIKCVWRVCACVCAYAYLAEKHIV